MASIPSQLQGMIGGRTRDRDAAFGLSVPAQLLIASLSGAAGVIHLVMVPSHMGESVLEGTGFAIAGWFQIAVAALVLARPSRLVLGATIPASLALIGLWALSRTAGLPFGPNAWHAESMTFIDLTCAGIEVALIVGAGLFLYRPHAGTAWSGFERFVALAASASVLVLATAALASPSARDHAAHSHGAHVQGDDKGFSLLANGHHHDIVQFKLHPTTQAVLNEQLDGSRAVARMYRRRCRGGGLQACRPVLARPGCALHQV